MAALAAAVLAVSATASAQSLPAGVHLGMTPDELRAAVPEAQRVARPSRFAGGSTGSWGGASTTFAGLDFSPAFFFAGRRLQRVEWTSDVGDVPERAAAAFAELLTWGRAQFGAEIASHDPGSVSASWSTADTDIYLQHVDRTGHAAVRLVYKIRRLKDASTL